LLNTRIVFGVGEEKPHEAAQRRRRCVRRRNNSDDPVRGRGLESRLFFFEAGFVSLCETGKKTQLSVHPSALL
jgi:hypothetical protein